MNDYVIDICWEQDVGTDGWKPKWLMWIISGRWTWPTWTSWNAIITCIDIWWSSSICTVDSHGSSPWKENRQTILMPSSSPYCTTKNTVKETMWCPNSSRQIWEQNFNTSDSSTSAKENDGRSFSLRIKIWKPRLLKHWLVNSNWWYRVVNVLNDSDVSTYVTFLDAIVERYNKSPHHRLARGRMLLYQNRFCTRVFWVYVFSPKRLCDADTFKSVSGKIHLQREVLGSGRKKRSSSARFIWPIQSHFERFRRRTIRGNILYGRIKRSIVVFPSHESSTD